MMRKNRMPNAASLFLFMLLFSLSGFAQTTTIKGTITDESNLPLPGVNIVIKGTTNGTITDLDGNYSLEASSTDVLLFSFIGYINKEVPVGNQTTIDVNMVPSMMNLDDVVVVGYGTMKKSDLTGAVMSANIKDFEKAPNTNLVQSLQGTVPGLNIGQSTNAGGTPEISIRGTNTISGSKSVLIVLDGIIYTNSLSSINPADIESVDVLKDASATAIYGAQAANGVILITSKKGKAGQTKVTFSSSYSVQQPSKNLSTMNRQQMLDFVTEVMWDKAYTEESGYTTPNPDFNLAQWMPDSYMTDGEGNIVSTDYPWWDASTRTGYIFENKLSISGGSKDVSYMLSLGNTNQQNYLVNDDFKRNSVRLNLDANPYQWLKVGVQAFGSFVNQDGAEPILWTLLSMNPLATPYNEDGTLKPQPMETARDNPFLGSDVSDHDRNNYFFGNLYAEIKLPIEGLTYRMNFGNNYRIGTHYYSSKYGNSQSGLAYKRISTNYDYTIDNIVNYKRSFGAHDIEATFVYGATERKYSHTNAEANTFARLTLGYNSLEQGTNQFTYSDAWSEALLYQMARVNYKYNNKYLVTATVRRDGFSGFAENHKSAVFPSVALGWVISEEDFFDVSWLDYLKLRAGYGISGNQTSRYASLSTVASEAGYVFGDGGTSAIRQELNKLGNSDLKWEKTTGTNLGIDFNMLDERVFGSLEVYKTTTNDLLYNVAIPTITGFGTISSNVGEIQNKGIEFTVTTQNIVTPNFKWTTTLNISSNSNEIVHLTGLDADGDGVEDDLVSSNLFIGQPISAVYGYKVDGIYQLDDEIPTGYHPGNYRILNTDGNEEINTDDRVILGKKDPAYRFGIMNKFDYKGLSLSFFINSVQGGKDGYLGENYAIINQDDNARRLNRISEMAGLFWSPNNPDGIYSSSPDNAAITPTVYMDRSFIRLQDVTVSYDLPKSLYEKMSIENVNVYVGGKNLLTITDWKGWDPESNVGSINGVNKGGNDYDGRPVMRSFTAGINVTF